jgi:glycosyltransferase involved in cell wall biosynthesis
LEKKLAPNTDGSGANLSARWKKLGKQPTLADAAAVLFPIKWPEAFALFLIENNSVRNACGCLPRIRCQKR